MALCNTQTGAASAMFLTSCQINNALEDSFQTNLDTFSKEMQIMGYTSIVQQKCLEEEGRQNLNTALMQGIGQAGAGLLGFAIQMAGEGAANRTQNETVQGRNGAQADAEEVGPGSTRGPTMVEMPETAGASGNGTLGNGDVEMQDMGTSGRGQIGDNAPSSGPTKGEQRNAANARQDKADESKTEDDKLQNVAMERANSIRNKYGIYASMVRDMVQGSLNAGSGAFQNYEKEAEARALDCSAASSAANSEAGIANSAMGNAQSLLQANGSSFSSIIQISTSRV